MNNTTKQNEKKTIEQVENVKELNETELESLSGAMEPDHCPHWTKSAKTWGF